MFRGLNILSVYSGVTHVFVLVGGNGGDVTRFVPRRVDVHVEVAERIESHFVVGSIPRPLVRQTCASSCLNLLNLGFDICRGRSRFLRFCDSQTSDLATPSLPSCVVANAMAEIFA